MNSAKTIKHGLVLDHLLKLEKSELFSFMDSDIFATSAVSMSDIEPLSGEVACSGCLPVWHSEDDVRMPESYQVMGGRYINSESGRFLGCSYMASYRTQPLRELTQSMGLSFGRYVQKDLSPEVLVNLADMGLTKQVYDTAKVINLMLQHQGMKMSFRDVEGLVHVGGISGPVSKQDFDPTGLKRTIKILTPPWLLKLINMRRYGCGQTEINDIAELNERRSRACELIAELGNGPPYSAKTTALMRREGYVQALAQLYATYAANGKQFDSQPEGELHGRRPVAKNPGALR
ncbi:MAG: hypothetical protein ACR2RD_02020 [Woeseiaceae bacterium]